MISERTVLVTGFGPFMNHEVNASWEAVKELYKRKDELLKRHNIKLIIDRVSVIYDHVAEKVPQLWREHDPQIVLHVGVSHKATCLTIENRAHAAGYTRLDIEDKCPPEDPSRSSPLFLETGVNVEELCRKINDKNIANECAACVSQDAGRYLCEYIFHQSLCIQPERTLFVHVPDFSVYTSQTTANGLYDVIVILAESL